jgi:hypothetical protein
VAILPLAPESFFHLMPFGFIANSSQQGLLNVLLTASLPKNRTKISLPVIKQAGTEHTFRG